MKFDQRIKKRLVRLGYAIGPGIPKRLSPAAASELIEGAIREARPFAMGRLGLTELMATVHLKGYLKWYHTRLSAERIERQLFVNAGVYPENEAIQKRFATLFEECLREADLIGIYDHVPELAFLRRIRGRASVCDTKVYNLFIWDLHWTDALAGKRVLLITPFVDTIRQQIPRLEAVWRDSDFTMPEAAYEFIRTPYSPALTGEAEHGDWFGALEDLKRRMASVEYDVALISAGAYAVPLVNEAKAAGKVGINIGGCLQLLFGIRGRRWDGYTRLKGVYNEAWTRPLEAEVPAKAKLVEEGCYW